MWDSHELCIKGDIDYSPYLTFLEKIGFAFMASTFSVHDCVQDGGNSSSDFSFQKKIMK